MNNVPHRNIVVATCLIAVSGYGLFSWWAVFESEDSVLIGDTIGTWKSFATAAFFFWIGSSSGGKAADKLKGPAGNPNDPVYVEGEVK